MSRACAQRLRFHDSRQPSMSACVPGVRFESKQAITGSTYGFGERHKVLRARSSALVGGFWKGLGPQKYRDDGMYTGAVSLKFLLLSLVVWLKRILWRRDLVCRRGNLPYPWGRCLCGYYNCETLMRGSFNSVPCFHGTGVLGLQYL